MSTTLDASGAAVSPSRKSIWIVGQSLLRFTKPRFVYASAFCPSPIRTDAAGDACGETPPETGVGGTESPNVPFVGSPLLNVRAVMTGGSGAKSPRTMRAPRSEEHTSELQSLRHLVCRLL